MKAVCKFVMAFGLVNAAMPAIAKDIWSPLEAEGAWFLDDPANAEEHDFTCEREPLRIQIDLVSMRYVSEREGYRAEADILSIFENGFWLQYDDEDRLDSEGNILAWAFVSVDEETFVWVRPEWADTGESTAPRRRCQAPRLIS